MTRGCEGEQTLTRVDVWGSVDSCLNPLFTRGQGGQAAHRVSQEAADMR